MVRPQLGQIPGAPWQCAHLCSLLLPRLVFTTRGTGVLVVCIQRRFAQQTLSSQDSEAASFWLLTKLSQGAAFHWLPLLVLAAMLS